VQMMAMIKYQLKLLFQNRLAIFATISAPLILTFLFSFSQESDQENLYVANTDRSLYSKQLIDMIQSHKNIKVVQVTEDELKKKVDKQDISFGLVIQKDFGSHLEKGNKLKIKFVENHENESGVLFKNLVTAEVGTLKKLVKDSQFIATQLKLDQKKIEKDIWKGIESSAAIVLHDNSLSNGEKTQNDSAVRLFGFLVMFIWFVVIQGLRTLIDEKENNTLNRLLSIPVSYQKYVFSKMTASYISGIIHIIIIILAGTYFLKISIEDNALAIGIILAVYLFALTNITIVIIPFMKSQKQFTSAASIIIAVTGMLGGSFFPLEIAPKYMQVISKFTPEAWAIQSLNHVMFNKWSLGTEFIPLALFTGIGLFCLMTSLFLINRHLKRQTI